MAKQKKLKCYYIMLSTKFAKEHPKAGESTEFVEKVERKEKIHTIRKNYEYWRKRFEKINNGKAYLSLRTWTGTPYKSKQKEFLKLYNTDGIGIEKLETLPFGNHVEETVWIEKVELAKNDGLTYKDFKDWFNNPQDEPYGIIHFTNFRYGK